jgi:mRNA degradation ribonuclease J1/J2
LSKAFLTPYGGVNRIGGNIFLIEDSNSKVFLDFGLDFEKYRLYFDYPINTPKTTSELVTTGILPKIFSHNGKQFFQYCELEKRVIRVVKDGISLKTLQMKTFPS